MGSDFDGADLLIGFVMMLALVGFWHIAAAIWRWRNPAVCSGRFTIVGPDGEVRSVPGDSPIGRLIEAVEPTPLR